MSASLPLADELSAVFARLSGLLLTEETVHTSLGLVARLAHEAIPASVGAGVTLVAQSGQRRTTAATDDLIERFDRLQYELDEGPCLTSFAERKIIRVHDTGRDGRFPRWGPAAGGMGVRAVVSAPLVAGDVCLGAMKVYAAEPGSFDDRAQRILWLLAQQAAVLLANMQAYEKAERVSEQLREALVSRDTISTAKGILMCRDNLPEHEALRMLVSMAHRQNRTLRDVAQTVIATVQRRNR